MSKCGTSASNFSDSLSHRMRPIRWNWNTFIMRQLNSKQDRDQKERGWKLRSTLSAFSLLWLNLCLRLCLSKLRATCWGTPPRSVSLCVVNEVWPLRQQKSIRQLHTCVCLGRWENFFGGLWKCSSTYNSTSGRLVPPPHSFSSDLHPNDIPVWPPSSQPCDEWAALIYIIRLEFQEYKWKENFRNSVWAPYRYFWLKRVADLKLKCLNILFFLLLVEGTCRSFICRELKCNPNRIRCSLKNLRRRVKEGEHLIPSSSRTLGTATKAVFLPKTLISGQLKAVVLRARCGRKSKVYRHTIPHQASKPLWSDCCLCQTAADAGRMLLPLLSYWVSSSTSCRVIYFTDNKCDHVP